MADLYVAPFGSDLNSGFSSDQPLRTIQRAIDIVSTPERDVVIGLAEGEYEGGVKAAPGASITVYPRKR